MNGLKRILSRSKFRFPAEWEPHSCMWMSWPTEKLVPGYHSEEVISEIVSGLHSSTKISLLVNENMVNQVNDQKISTDEISMYTNIPYDGMWIRDFGPLFLQNTDEGTSPRLTVANFGFNDWGYEGHYAGECSYDDDNKNVAKSIADEIRIPIQPYSGLFGEGGSKSFNGKGSVIVSREVERQRNPDLTLDEIEEKLKNSLYVEHVIFLEMGPVEDQLTFKGQLPQPPEYLFTTGTTGGHVDEFAVFVGEKTVLLAETSEEEASLHKISEQTRTNLEKNFEILKNEVDQDGNQLEIVRIPTAPLMMKEIDRGDLFDYLLSLKYEDGTVIKPSQTVTVVLSSSYVNFVISNGIILLPKYADSDPSLFYKTSKEKVEELDCIAGNVMQNLFPDYEIKRVNPVPLHFGGGGMHCITQQQPY